MRKSSWLNSNQALGLLFSLVFIWVGCARWIFHHGNARPWAIVVAVAFLACAIISPDMLAPVNKAWTWLGATLGKIVTPVVLGVLFFGIVTPAGILFRRFASGYRAWKPDPTLKTYWNLRTHSNDSAHNFKNQF